MQLQKGSFLQSGKYKIEKSLGQGGFGITYLGVQVRLNRKVAIKEFFMKELCNRDYATSRVYVGSEGSRELVNRFRNKFLKEAQTIAALDDSHVIRIYDVFEENGTAYYVMEYLDSGDLLGRIPAGGMEESDALAYIRELCKGLTYIHSHNILHLDVKPSNVLFRKTGETVIIDFGISKHYDDLGGQQTSTTPVGMSTGYAPMEQYARGGISSFSAATDIYSVGATLYHLLTGVRPPEANIISEDGLPELPDSISLSTRRAVCTAMSPRRKDRPQNVAEFLLLLDSVMATDLRTDENSILNEAEPDVKLFVQDQSISDTILDDSVLNLTSHQDELKKMSVASISMINGHEYVDLGLPSGLKWATHNLGARYPEDFGSYYTWKEIYSQNSYLARDRDLMDLNFSSEEIRCNLKNDIVQKKWGGSWRLPTKDELEELVNNCQWIWINKNGCNGHEVIGPNNHSIFLPACGCRFLSANYNIGENGRYWSSTPDDSKTFGLFRLNFLKEYYSVYWQGDAYGLNIRPVSD